MEKAERWREVDRERRTEGERRGARKVWWQKEKEGIVGSIGPR